MGLAPIVDVARGGAVDTPGSRADDVEDTTSAGEEAAWPEEMLQKAGKA
jgi:hypothetical protein